MGQHQLSFEHQGFTYKIKPLEDNISLKISCLDETKKNILWETTQRMVSSDTLILFWYWSTTDDQVTLQTLGEHSRGGTIHERARHFMSPLGYLSVQDA